MRAPKLVIRVPDGRAALTKVTLNSADVMATRVSFDTGDRLDGMVKARIEFYADIDVEMTGGVVELSPKTSRVAMPVPKTPDPGLVTRG